MLLQKNRQKPPNNLINADHYHGGESKFIGFSKVPAVIKLIAGYPWQVIRSLGMKMIRYAIHEQAIDWHEAVTVFERAPLGKQRRDPEKLKRAFESSYAVV